MNRKYLLLLLFLFFGITVAMSQNSHVCYVKDHLYYHLGDEMNVIDIDVEWPEKIDGSLVKPLQRWLAEKLMRVDADNFADAYTKMKSQYGEPVREKFKSLPDDRKYCYVTCELKEMGYEPYKYISYILTRLSSPASLSSQKADTTVTLVTYDLTNQRVLTVDDIIRRSRVESNAYSRRFLRLLVDGAGQEIEGRFNAMQLLDCCLVGDDVFFNTLWTGEEDKAAVVSAVPWTLLKDYMEKDMYKWLRQPAMAIADEGYSLPFEKDGKRIFIKTEEDAEFPGGKDALMKYMSENIIVPSADNGKQSDGKVVTTFIVNEDGMVSDVAVIKKHSPAVDRAVVKAIKAMPRWKPAKQNGEAVKVKYMLPTAFRLDQ